MKPLLLLAVTFLLQAKHHDSCSQTEREKWYEASQLLDHVVWPLKGPFIQLLNNVTRDYSVAFSTDCRTSLQQFSSGLSSGSREAYLLFDSFSKTHSGFLGERPYDYGDYNQCLKAQFNGSDTRYVILALAMPVPEDRKIIKYHDEQDNWIAEFSNKIPGFRTANVPFAICLPTTCTEEDVKQMIQSNTIKNLMHPSHFQLYSTESLNDEVKSDRPLLRLISMALLLGIVGTVAASTLLNYVTPESKILRSFDAVANTEKLFSDGKPENRNLSFMNGLRALYLILNIPSHVGIPHVEATFPYNFSLLRSTANFSPFTRMITVTAGHYVSSNVLMAASLSAIGWLPEMKRNSKIGFRSFVILRALRTLPVMMAFILITFTFPVVGPGGGPIMTTMQNMLSSKCYQHGWKDLLFISNFGTFHEMCMPVGWFMAADFQLYIMSFIYLGFLNTRPRMGFYLIAIQVVAGILIHAWYLNAVDVPSVLMLWTWDGYNNLHNYVKLFTHTFNYIAVYPIGVVLGYLMVNGYRIDTKNRGITFLGLFLVTSLSLHCPAFLFEDSDFAYGGRRWEIIFGSLHRVVFVICYAATCLLLHGNPDFVVSRLLSSKWLTVLSRFSYSAFMAHPLVIMFMLSSLPDVSITTTYLNLMCLYAIVVSLFAGYLFFLLFEAPAMNLLKSMAGNRVRKSSQERKSSLESNNNHHSHIE